MKTTLLSLLGIIVIAGVIYAFSTEEQKDSPAAQQVVTVTNEPAESINQDDAMMKNEDDMDSVDHQDDAMMMKEENPTTEETTETVDTSMEKAAGSFVKLEDTDISTLSGKIVLDFSATWCPSCQVLKKDIEASLSDIPADTTIVLVDYDTNKDLRVKYGVTGQHTFVQVNSAGEKIKLWRGGTTLEDVLKNIQ